MRRSLEVPAREHSLLRAASLSRWPREVMLALGTTLTGPQPLARRLGVARMEEMLALETGLQPVPCPLGVARLEVTLTSKLRTGLMGLQPVEFPPGPMLLRAQLPKQLQAVARAQRLARLQVRQSRQGPRLSAEVDRLKAPLSAEVDRPRGSLSAARLTAVTRCFLQRLVAS